MYIADFSISILINFSSLIFLMNNRENEYIFLISIRGYRETRKFWTKSATAIDEVYDHTLHEANCRTLDKACILSVLFESKSSLSFFFFKDEIA